jgi:hypothetical protein
MLFLHSLFVFPLIEDAVRWSSNTLAFSGFEHAAYWVSFIWVPDGWMFWITWLLQCLILLAIIPGLLSLLNKADGIGERHY